MISACFNYIVYKIKESLPFEPEDPMKGTYSVHYVLKVRCSYC